MPLAIHRGSYSAVFCLLCCTLSLSAIVAPLLPVLRERGHCLTRHHDVALRHHATASVTCCDGRCFARWRPARGDAAQGYQGYDDDAASCGHRSHLSTTRLARVLKWMCVARLRRALLRAAAGRTRRRRSRLPRLRRRCCSLRPPQCARSRDAVHLRYSLAPLDHPSRSGTRWHLSTTRLARVLKWMCVARLRRALLRAEAGHTRRRRSRLPRLRRRCCSLRPPQQGCGGRDTAEAERGGRGAHTHILWCECWCMKVWVDRSTSA
ncbi:hypothetical protein T492DRAFT_940634 [Pavlovales sp. CCMP2436]|nr:hypothetical protein T492DRAFT_940634 [Pavlovales sp. CCMP2436]